MQMLTKVDCYSRARLGSKLWLILSRLLARSHYGSSSPKAIESKALHSIDLNLSSLLLYIMATFSYGITRWARSSAASTSMMVGGPAMTRAALTYITGPVRGVAFHPTRDLLVTGGDDYKVRVWGTHTPKSFGEKLILVRTSLQTRKYRIASVSSLFMAIWTMFARANSTTRCPGLCAIIDI